MTGLYGVVIALCVKHLHRHPLDVNLPMSAIMEIAAYDDLSEPDKK